MDMKAYDSGVSGYRVADIDEASDPRYYGYTAKGGVWYIMKESVVNGSFRYCSGISNYATNWAGRGALVYVYFHQGV